LAKNLLVPYQKALKLVLSVNNITLPLPKPDTLNGTVLGIKVAFTLEWYPLKSGEEVY
jgi:hypothetical protein